MADYGNEISSISLGSIIGGALSAIVEAQSQAAHTTVNFINEVGFEGNPEERKPVYVNFQYEKTIQPDKEEKKEGQEDEGGQAVNLKQITNLKVPLLTMVPIPYIRVDDATIDFNVKINSVQETKTSSDLTYGGNVDAHANYNGFRFKTGIKLSASISNQKKSSRSDNVQRDYSLNIHVHAKQDDMPAGVEHLLDLLSDASSTETRVVPVKERGEGKS
ncbi:MAG: DUF2589 domain-containing protein [Lachnospiraceae bacterium]|nr:DUF2589 domain-containing protein [Lachnospiraceae bacterium]